MKIPNAAVLQRTNPHKRDWRLTFWPFLIALAALLVTPLAAHAQDDTPARVARIANFGGQLLLEFELSQQVRGGRIKKENLPLEIDNEDRIGN